MKIRVCYSDTCTGEDVIADIEHEGPMTQANFLNSFKADAQAKGSSLEDLNTLVLRDLVEVENGIVSTYGFIMTGKCAYFGNYLVTGHIYTVFR